VAARQALCDYHEIILDAGQRPEGSFITLIIKSKVEVPELIELRRGQIIAAAIELFGERGYHHTAIREVAKHADISIGTIYQYVTDEEDVLFLALAPHSRRVSGPDGLLQRFRAAVAAYCRPSTTRGPPRLCSPTAKPPAAKSATQSDQTKGDRD
jgi:AcrR family transcriptional regulator